MSTISGNVRIAGVPVSLGTLMTTSDASGNYSFTGLSAGNYLVLPQLPGYSFSPANIDIALSGSDSIGNNFTPSIVGGYSQLSMENLTGANQNPIDPSSWTTLPGETALQLINNVIEATTTHTSYARYIAVSFSNDQYCEVYAILFASAGEINILLRQSGTIAGGNYYTFAVLANAGGTSLALEIRSLINGSLALNVAYPFASNSCFIRAEAKGTTLNLYINNVLALTATDSSDVSGGIVLNPQSTRIGTHLTDSQIASFVVGNLVAAAYSVPDCRISPVGPNASRNVQSTLIYDVQTSDNSTVPGVDSRVAGAPIDSRVISNIPQNSRTPGTYGPGE